MAQGAFSLSSIATKLKYSTYLQAALIFRAISGRIPTPSEICSIIGDRSEDDFYNMLRPKKILNSACHTLTQNLPPEEVVKRMYKTYFLRDPDPGGLSYWSKRYAKDGCYALVKIIESALKSGNADGQKAYEVIENEGLMTLFLGSACTCKCIKKRYERYYDIIKKKQEKFKVVRKIEENWSKAKEIIKNTPTLKPPSTSQTSTTLTALQPQTPQAIPPQTTLLQPTMQQMMQQQMLRQQMLQQQMYYTQPPLPPNKKNNDILFYGAIAGMVLLALMMARGD